MNIKSRPKDRHLLDSQIATVCPLKALWWISGKLQRQALKHLLTEGNPNRFLTSSLFQNSANPSGKQQLSPNPCHRMYL